MQATVSKIKNGILPKISMAFRADDNFTGTGTRSIRALSLDGGDVSVVRRGANRSTEVSVRGQAPGAFEVRSSGLIALRQDVVAGNEDGDGDEDMTECPRLRGEDRGTFPRGELSVTAC